MPFSRIRKHAEKPYGKNYSTDPQTFGEQLRNRRLELRLLQKEVAQLLKVSTDTVTYWENNRYPPHIQHYPAIIQFLGHNPFLIEGSHPGEKVKWYRYEHGLSQKAFAKLIGVDASTIAYIEGGQCSTRSKALQKHWSL